jgi:radical SAM protein with 4Fe4S-binding SPASM domain
VSLAKQFGATPQIEVCVADSIEGDKCVSKYLRLRPEELEVVLRDKYVPMYVGPEVMNYGGEKKNLDRYACGAGRNSLCVTPDGDIIPCCAFHLKLGNIRKESVSQIIHSNNRKEWLNCTLKDYEECGTHPYCDFCNLCPGVNYSEHATHLKPGENNCYMAKTRYGVYLKMTVDGIDPLGDKRPCDALARLTNEYPEIKIEK